MPSKDRKEQELPFFFSKYAESKAYFRDIATPKKFLKEVRSHTTVSCAQCTKPAGGGVKFSVCAKCKVTSYCSRDCQKKDWPIHKYYCVETAFSTPKLVNNFISNPVFATFIQISAILAFGLDKSGPVLDRPLLAQCNICIEPNLLYLMGLITRTLPPAELDKGTEGMLQVKSFNAASSSLLDRTRTEMWKNTSRANAAQFANRTVVVIDFQMSGSEQSISAGVVIQDHSLEMVKEGCGFQLESAILPGKKNVPLTIDGCVSFMNKHIRADDRNQTLMRKMHMTKQDVEEYRRQAAQNTERRS